MSEEVAVAMIVSTSHCFPPLSSACATHLPSLEIAEQTEVPAFVTGAILVCTVSELNRLLNLRTAAGKNKRTTSTLETPVKSAAFLCDRIPLRRVSVRYRACDLRRVKIPDG